MKTKIKVLTTCDIEPGLWLDYVEGELDPSLQSDLKLHLQNCKVCQQNFSEFKTIRTVVEKTAVTEIPNEEFFKTLEAKIMGSLDNRVAADSPTVVVKRFVTRPMGLPSLAAAAALFLLIFGGLYKTMSFKPVSSTEVV